MFLIRALLQNNATFSSSAYSALPWNLVLESAQVGQTSLDADVFPLNCLAK